MEKEPLEDRYTYRVAWSECRMKFIASCDEIRSCRGTGCNVSKLLGYVHSEASQFIKDMVAHGERPPKPMHPDSCYEISSASEARALADCYARRDTGLAMAAM